MLEPTNVSPLQKKFDDENKELSQEIIFKYATIKKRLRKSSFWYSEGKTCIRSLNREFSDDWAEKTKEIISEYNSLVEKYNANLYKILPKMSGSPILSEKDGLPIYSEKALNFPKHLITETRIDKENANIDHRRKILDFINETREFITKGTNKKNVCRYIKIHALIDDCNLLIKEFNANPYPCAQLPLLEYDAFQGEYK